MTREEYIAYINNSSFIHNVNTGKVLDNSLGAKKQAQGLAFNTGQLYNDRTNVYADNTKPQSNYARPSQGLGN